MYMYPFRQFTSLNISVRLFNPIEKHTQKHTERERERKRERENIVRNVKVM